MSSHPMNNPRFCPFFQNCGTSVWENSRGDLHDVNLTGFLPRKLSELLKESCAQAGKPVRFLCKVGCSHPMNNPEVCPFFQNCGTLVWRNSSDDLHDVNLTGFLPRKLSELLLECCAQAGKPVRFLCKVGCSHPMNNPEVCPCFHKLWHYGLGEFIG